MGISIAAGVPDVQRNGASQFIAVSPPNYLIYYADGVRNQVTIRQEPTALATIVCGEAIALLGTADGELEAVRVQTGESIIKFRKHS